LYSTAIVLLDVDELQRPTMFTLVCVLHQPAVAQIYTSANHVTQHDSTILGEVFFMHTTKAHLLIFVKHTKACAEHQCERTAA
jgi:hypothetical protein